MSQSIKPGLGELLRHLVELTDGSADTFYQQLPFAYRPRYTPIMRVLASGPASVSDLKTQLNITQGAVSQTIKLMLQDQLIEKYKGQDARQSIVRISEQGEAALQRLTPHWQAIFQAIEGLETDIQQPLMQTLQRTSQALEQQSFAQRIQVASELGNTPLQSVNQQSMHFQTGGAEYAQFRPSYPESLGTLLATLVQKSQLTPKLAVDVGCGSGQLTSLLAPHFGQVVGIDPSTSQLQHAQQHHNVRYQQGHAEQLDIADASADLVVAAQAAHWFNLDAFYAEVKRIAKPAALIALISYGVPFIYDAANSVFQQAYWQDVHRFWPPERQHVENAYSQLYFPFPRISLAHIPGDQLSYQRCMHLSEFINYIKTWSAYQQALKQNQAHCFDALFSKLEAVWHPSDAKQVVWPLTLKVGQVA